MKTKILVSILIKNNSKSLIYQLDELSKIEDSKELDISYIFLENGSTDGSDKIIREFMHKRNGLFVNAGNTPYLNKLDRISRISKLRNMAKDLSKSYEFDWYCLIDSDIFFSVENFLKIVNNANANVNANIKVLCAYGIAYLPSENKILSNGHYYDTATLLLNSTMNSHYPKCPFSTCIECGASSVKYKDDLLIEVYSAFGGLALINNTIMKNDSIFWEPKSVLNSPINEHIGFFEKMHQLTNYKVAIDMSAPVYWDISTINLK